MTWLYKRCRTTAVKLSMQHCYCIFMTTTLQNLHSSDFMDALGWWRCSTREVSKQHCADKAVVLALLSCFWNVVRLQYKSRDNNTSGTRSKCGTKYVAARMYRHCRSHTSCQASFAGLNFTLRGEGNCPFPAQSPVALVMQAAIPLISHGPWTNKWKETPEAINTTIPLPEGTPDCELNAKESDFELHLREY